MATWQTQGQSIVVSLSLTGRTVPITVLRVQSPDQNLIIEELGARLQASPDFFRHTLFLIDLSGASRGGSALDLERVVALLREKDAVPVYVQGAVSGQETTARALGLVPWKDGMPFTRSGRMEKAEEAVSEPQVVPTVRSGQRVYARDRDLIVFGAVNSGAEAIADGSIHVYGPLRGRAMAGAQGNRSARIFCQQMHAELLSIAGVYRTFEHQDPAMLNRAAQVRLADERLIVDVVA